MPDIGLKMRLFFDHPTAFSFFLFQFPRLWLCLSVDALLLLLLSGPAFSNHILVFSLSCASLKSSCANRIDRMVLAPRIKS